MTRHHMHYCDKGGGSVATCAGKVLADKRHRTGGKICAVGPLLELLRGVAAKLLCFGVRRAKTSVVAATLKLVQQVTGQDATNRLTWCSSEATESGEQFEHGVL